MAIYRQLYTEFWNDDFMIELSSESKYFYIYLLTNPKTTQCGIFRFVKKLVSLETGLSTNVIDNCLQEFVDCGKILYSAETNEIMVLNWYKYNNTINHKNIRTCINNELKRVKCHDFIKKFHDICTSLCNTNEADPSILSEIFKNISLDTKPSMSMPVIREKSKTNEQATQKPSDEASYINPTEISSVLEVFNENIHKASLLEEAKLRFWLKTMEAEVIITAINQAVLRNALNISYVNAILNNWQTQGVNTLKALNIFLKEKQSRKSQFRNENNYNSNSTEGVPPYFTPFSFNDANDK